MNAKKTGIALVAGVVVIGGMLLYLQKRVDKSHDLNKVGSEGVLDKNATVQSAPDISDQRFEMPLTKADGINMPTELEKK